MISSATHTGDSEFQPDLIWTECHLDRWGGGGGEVREGLCSVHGGWEVRVRRVEVTVGAYRK